LEYESEYRQHLLGIPERLGAPRAEVVMSASHPLLL
jgi:hypothetical protein